MDEGNLKFSDEMSRQPFSVPENYFDNFADNFNECLQLKLKEGRETNDVRVDLRRFVITVMSAAAVFAGLIIGGFALINLQKEVEYQSEQIIAQETYAEEMFDMVELDYVEDVLADIEFYDDEY